MPASLISIFEAFQRLVFHRRLDDFGHGDARGIHEHDDYCNSRDNKLETYDGGSCHVFGSFSRVFEQWVVKFDLHMQEMKRHMASYGSDAVSKADGHGDEM